MVSASPTVGVLTLGVVHLPAVLPLGLGGWFTEAVEGLLEVRLSRRLVAERLEILSLACQGSDLPTVASSRLCHHFTR